MTGQFIPHMKNLIVFITHKKEGVPRSLFFLLLLQNFILDDG